MVVCMKYWLNKKVRQLHSIMWFIGGFGLGCGYIAVSAVCIAIAIAIDICISILVSKIQTQSF